MTDREKFPHSILWQTDCPDWHDRESKGCQACAHRGRMQADAVHDPMTYAIMLRMEGIPSHGGFVIRPPKWVIRPTTEVT